MRAQRRPEWNDLRWHIPKWIMANRHLSQRYKAATMPAYPVSPSAQIADYLRTNDGGDADCSRDPAPRIRNC